MALLIGIQITASCLGSMALSHHHCRGGGGGGGGGVEQGGGV